MGYKLTVSITAHTINKVTNFDFFRRVPELVFTYMGKRKISPW